MTSISVGVGLKSEERNPNNYYFDRSCALNLISMVNNKLAKFTIDYYGLTLIISSSHNIFRGTYESYI